MQKRHEEYAACCQARVSRYKGNPHYERSYEAEKRMYEAIAGCARLEDFRAVVEKDHPDVQCSIARPKSSPATS